jgi:hypothetical protein
MWRASRKVSHLGVATAVRAGRARFAGLEVERRRAELVRELAERLRARRPLPVFEPRDVGIRDPRFGQITLREASLLA